MLVHELYYEALDATPHKLAVVCQEQTMTYLQLHRQTNRFTRSLLALGVKKGDRVGVIMHNIPQYVGLYMACSRVGAVVVNVSCYSSVPIITFMLEHSSAEWLFYGNDLHDKSQEIISLVSSLKGVYPVDTPLESDCSAWMNHSDDEVPDAELPELTPDENSVIIYTSGSTSKPKGTVHTHYSMTHCAIVRVETLRLSSDDTYLSAAYLCHAAAFMITLFPMLYVGGTSVFPKSYTIDDFMRLLVAHAPNIASSGPAQLWEIIEHPDLPSAQLSGLRYFSCGGDVVPMELHRRFADVFGFPLSESIGMTECSTYLTTPTGMEHRLGSMGKPVIGAEVRLIDDQGCEVSSGECGEIIVRARTIMKEYWNDPEATASTLHDGWVHTGDIGRKDEDGYFYFVGRKKMMIVRNSCNIPPLMLEMVINNHPQIKNSCVVGVPDPRIGQRVVAFFEPLEEPFVSSVDELNCWVKSHVLGFMSPDEWIVVKQLPATAMGKIDRAELLRQYNERQVNQESV